MIAEDWRPDPRIFLSFLLQLGMGKFASLALHLKEIDNEAEVAENEKSFTCSCSGILTIKKTN